MNITKYTGYFHDGNLIDIKHEGKNIDFFIESAQIDNKAKISKKILSESNTLKGKLSLSNIQNIKIGNQDFKGTINKIHDDGEILDLEISSNKILILIEWKNFPPKPRETFVDKIEIEAMQICWENIPHLANS